jgi:hypothetical protein
MSSHLQTARQVLAAGGNLEEEIAKAIAAAVSQALRPMAYRGATIEETDDWDMAEGSNTVNLRGTRP